MARPELRDLDPDAVVRVVVVIARYWAEYGYGPSWRIAARAAGWVWRDNAGRVNSGYVSDELADRFYVLKRAGLITFSKKARSLDVTRAGARWAITAHRRTQVARARGARQP